MIFKGIKFRRNRNVLILGEHPSTHKDAGYVIFGQIIPQRVIIKNGLPKDAVKSNHKWNTQEGEPVYCRLVVSDGYSRSNMMYGKDKVYMAWDGVCYTAPLQHKSASLKKNRNE